MATFKLKPRNQVRLIPRAPEKKPSFARELGTQIIGDVEGALATATGFSEFLGQAIPGAAGIGKLVSSRGDVQAATETIRSYQEAIQPYFRYEPKTEKGKQRQESIAKALDFLIGKPSRKLGGFAQKGFEALDAPTAGAIAGTIVETGTSLAGFAALLGLLKAPLPSKTKIQQGKPLSARDIAEFEKHMQETAIFAKAKTLQQSDILEALRGKPSTPEAVEYLKVLTTKERAQVARDILKKQDVKLTPRPDIPVERGRALPESVTIKPRQKAPIESKIPREKEVRATPDTPVYGELAKTVTSERVKAPIDVGTQDILADFYSIPDGVRGRRVAFDARNLIEQIEETAQMGDLFSTETFQKEIEDWKKSGIKEGKFEGQQYFAAMLKYYDTTEGLQKVANPKMVEEIRKFYKSQITKKAPKPIKKPITPENIAGELDIIYNGEAEGLFYFTDKITQSTFTTTDLTKVPTELEDMRQTFAEVEGIEPAPKLEKGADPTETVVEETIDFNTGLPLTKIIPKSWMPKWLEFWVPFSSVPNRQDVLIRRYRQFGEIDKAARTVSMVFDRLKRYSPEVNKSIFQYLDGELSLLDLPLSARHDANRIKTLTRTIGNKLVKEKILTQAAFDANPNYVHYMFARHVIGDDGAIGMGPTGKLNLSYTIGRNPDLTKADRQALGLIEDASVAVPVGMGKALVDIAKKRYLRSLAEDPNVTWQPSIIELADGRKMGIGRLSKEVEAMGKVVEEAPTPETQARFDELNDALQAAIEETKNVPSGFKQLPSDKFYGPLAGAFVRKPVADDIMPLFSSIAGTHRGDAVKTLLAIEAEGMTLFKVTHVALNFPTAFRNVVSNVLQNNLRGRPLTHIPGDFIKAAQSMLDKDVHFIEARKHGLFRTNWAITEISEVLDEFTKVDTGNWHTFLNALKKVAKYYGKIDDMAKHTIYVQMRNDGADIPVAVLEAQKWGMDYSLASRSVKELRRHIIPFITYQYKIAPLIYESVARNPLIIGKYVALLGLLAPFIVKAMHDIDEDEWDKMQRDLPRQIRKSGSPMLLPWKDKEGRWQWVNLEYYFPWGNWLNIYRDLRSADFSELARDSGIGNPFLDVLSALKSGIGGKPPKDPYSGIPIYNELDSEVTKRLKLLEFLYNKWAPSMVTEYGALGYSVKVGEKDRWGKTATTSQAIGRWFGFNIKAADPKQTKAIKAHRIKEITKDFIRIKTDPTVSKKEKQRAFELLKKKRTEILEGKD